MGEGGSVTAMTNASPATIATEPPAANAEQAVLGAVILDGEFELFKQACNASSSQRRGPH